jgi:hypothetical protein
MEEIGLNFCFTRVGEELRKTVCCILLGEDGGRPGGGEGSSPLPWIGPGRPAPAPWATAAASRADGFGSQEKITREEGRGTAGAGRGSREIGAGGKRRGNAVPGGGWARGGTRGGAIVGEGRHVLGCPAIL